MTSLPGVAGSAGEGSEQAQDTLAPLGALAMTWESPEWLKNANDDVVQSERDRVELFRQSRGDTYVLLLDVLNSFDPMGLVGLGCPPTEYVLELTPIFERLDEIETIEALQSLVHDVFAQMFGREWAGSVEDFGPLAQAMWDVVRPAP